MTPVDTLRVELIASGPTSPRDPVTVVLRVENISGRPLELYLRGREVTMDLVVTRAGEEAPLWSLLEGEVIPAIIRFQHLDSGGVLEARAAWSRRDRTGTPVPPGEYILRGELLTEDRPLVAEARVVLR